MNLYKKFKTDEQKEVEGVWVPLNATSRIKVARMFNPKYRAAMKRLTAPYTQGGVVADVPNDVNPKLVMEAVAETILVDWDGILDEHDQPLPYSKEAALKACAELKDFYLLVLSMADNMETFRVHGQAVLEKN